MVHIARTHSVSVQKRIDYVAFPLALPVWNLTSSVLLIVLSITKDDHWSPSVSFDVTLSECTAPLFTQPIAACDRQKFFDPESVAIFDSLCDNFYI